MESLISALGAGVYMQDSRVELAITKGATHVHCTLSRIVGGQLSIVGDDVRGRKGKVCNSPMDWRMIVGDTDLA